MEIRSNYHHSLDELQQKMLDMGAGVEHLIHSAVEALARHDDKLANDVIDSDDKIDELLQHIEELCLRLIALQQPIASDLRIIGTVLKNFEWKMYGIFAALNIPVKAKKSSLPKKERPGMMGLSKGSKPNTIKEALLL